ncbi:MAG: PAS domain S-box protein [Gemmatimonadota bacterium]
MDLYLRSHVLESLLAGMPAFMFSLRRGDLALLSVSRGVAPLTGFEARDLLAQPYLWAARIHAGDREKLVRLMAGLSAGAFLDEELRFRCADGKSRWLRMRMTPAPGPPGDPHAVAGVAWANEEVKSARRKAHQGVSILQSAGAPIFFTDIEGKIRLWNSECERFFGWDGKEIVGDTIHRLFPLPAPAVASLIRSVIEGGTVSREARLLTKTGQEADTSITIALVRDELGRPAGMVTHVAGTAERRGLESRLQGLVTRLRIIERVNRIIASDWDIRAAHGRIAGELDKLVDFDRTSIALFDEEEDAFTALASARGPADPGHGARLPLSGSAPGWVQARRITRIDDDFTLAEDRFAEDAVLAREGMRARLLIPLFVGDRIVGTLNFHSRKAGIYSLDVVEELGSIPDQLGLAIEKYNMYTRLQGSEEKYRFLFEQGPPAATVDSAGRFVDVNEGCLRLYGYARAEFLALSPGDLSAAPGEEDLHADVFRTGVPREAEVLHRRKDGSVFWGWLDVFPASENLVLGQLTDITPRKNAEEALRREKDFTARVLSVANALIVALDADGRVLLFNRKCEEVTGWREDEIRGHRLWDDLIPEQGVAAVRDDFARIAEADIPVSRESPWRTRDGKERLILWNNSVARDEQGRILWIILAGIDVTEQRELEDRLRHAQKMEAVGTLAGGIAHDFNNIIQAIMGYATLIRNRGGDAEAFREELDAIERAGFRAAELTTQLLGFARGGKYEVRPTDLNGVVEKVVSMIRHTFDRSIAIRSELAPDLAAVAGDAGQLEHTLLNLCINARDAMPEGGLLLIETRNEALSPDDASRIAQATDGALQTPAGRFVSLSVTDTGVGIPSDDIPRIFEPFFTTKEPGKGTGMGLAMAYGIVKNHGGIMDVRSSPGFGSTFRVLLPASPEEAAPPAHAAPPEKIAGGSETILFVDDEESLRLLAVETLGRLGYSVTTARNGVEAIEIFSDSGNRIDLVILDMIMPGMGGEETFRRLRKLAPSARVLVSSGYAVEGKPGNLLAEGAAGFLQKPYRLATLATAVRRALDS